ncbi:MAG: VWA domain-containing protein [Deltaproteobacteria bacterium]|nr:VWA domain-containing protein [Deltaproteobacteria bacterium]
MTVRAPTSCLALGLMLASFGCSDVELRKLSKQAVFERNTVVGKICAPPYLDLDVPYRVLFVIDTSLSNEWNDPEERRVEAVRSAINSNIHNENVSFGVITFSDVPRVQTLSFTRDLVVLDGATKHIGVAQGGTNFSDTLWVAKSFILEDLNSMPPMQAARTHYLVFWLSDGFPTIGTTEPASILPMAATWADLLEDRVAEFRLHTAFLGAKKGSEAEETEAEAAQDLLEGMAKQGDGTFTDIPDGQAFSFEIDPAPMRALFQLRSVVLSNKHARFGEQGPVADSDGDGISDAQEEKLGLMPTEADTDNDGYRDGVEVLLGGALDPLLYNEGCESGARDTDLDGLRDCEELAANTQVENQDSDGDGLPDGLELLSGGSPLDDNPAFDRDHDGLPDSAEVRFHLDPKRPTDPKAMDNWAYRYEVRELPREYTDSPSCYELRIENVVMVPTKRVATQAQGANELEIFAAFSLDGGVEQRFFAASLLGRLIFDPYVIDPPNGLFEVGTMDFSPLP